MHWCMYAIAKASDNEVLFFFFLSSATEKSVITSRIQVSSAS